MENTYPFFTRLIGTLAVILLFSAYAGSTQLISIYNKKFGEGRDYKFIIVVGLLGGLFGVYGNLSGFGLHGAIISIRDIGVMLAGFLGGPVCGLISGVIAGVHRLFMGGITAVACVIATTLIGLFCGILSKVLPNETQKASGAFFIGFVMEAFHLFVVLVVVHPYSVAVDIVRQIAFPFVTVNAVGIALMIGIVHYIQNQQAMSMERQRLKSELEVASVIQRSLLPDLNEKYPGRPEVKVSAFMEAAKEVGGDFYDAFFVGPDRMAFLIGDVSGKGVPAAMFMASTKIILQNCIRDVADLAEAITRANSTLCEKNEADMFVTLWAGILDLKTGSLRYVCAGHNPPVLIRGGEADFIKGRSGFVLAGLEGVKYKAEELQLVKGDAVFLYTDGVTEATGDNNQLFGNERLVECLGGCVQGCGGSCAPEGVDVQATIDTVKASIDDFVKENEQFDDVTMLCFKWQG